MATNDRPITGQRPDTRPRGYTYLPGGPAFQNPTNLIKYLRSNPGYVWKNRAWLTAQAKREFGLAGYALARNGQLTQYEGSADATGARGKLLRAWLHDPKEAAQLTKSADHPKVITVKQANGKAAPAAKGPKPKPVSGGQVTAPGEEGARIETAPTPGAVDFSDLFGAVNAPTTKVLPEAWANNGAKLFDPKMAEQLAGLQYDTEIRDTGLDRDRMGRTNAQNLTDVGNWYGQVLGAQKTASGRDAAINDAAVDSVRDAGASILSAIGGQANQGAGMVGSANAQAVGTLEALGANQEMFNEDLRPLLESERAGARTREQAQGTSRAQDLAERLASLQGERGKAKAGYQFQIDQANNGIRDNRAQRALQIRESNNGIAQQSFQNALALANAQLGAAMTGVEIQGKLADLKAGNAPATSYPFAKAPVSQRNDAYQQALSSISGDGGLTTSVPRAVQLVNQVLAGYGWSRKNPAVMALRNQILTDAGIRPDPRWR
jgi:hypothetical protein